jgi:sigma-B regulation protein RsbU (phosphoserine phosphatase)
MCLCASEMFSRIPVYQCPLGDAIGAGSAAEHKGKVIGVVDLESTQIDYFTEHHERMLTTLASRIAAALVNAQLYARVSDNERRMDREMKIAREIQHQLMPEEVPTIEPLDIAVTFRPVAHLGGDLYDFIHFDDGTPGLRRG